MTYALYLDESYNSDYIIMAGFIVPLLNWKILNENILQLKKKFFGKDTFNLKSIRRHKYEDNKIWQALSREDQNKFNHQFYDLISKHRTAIISSVIDRKMMVDKQKSLIFRLAYSFIVQRYQYFLSEHKSRGLIFMDSAESSPEIKELNSHHKEFLSKGVIVDTVLTTENFMGVEMPLKRNKREPISNICENIIFQNDEDNQMLQISDMIAAAINSKYTRNYDGWFKKIEPIIRKSPGGKIEGWGIKLFPTRMNCEPVGTIKI